MKKDPELRDIMKKYAINPMIIKLKLLNNKYNDQQWN